MDQPILSPQEWVDLFHKEDKFTQRMLAHNGIWVNGLQLISHLLKADASNSFFKGKVNAEPQLAEMDRDIQIHAKGLEGVFNEAEEASYHPTNQWETFNSDIGDNIDIDRYLDRNPVCFRDRRKKLKDTAAISIMFDTSIPWSDRDGEEVKKRHDYIYQVAFQAEAEGKPCRVVAVSNTEIPELDGEVRVLAIIKDYLDPIFPGLWGAFVSNRATNSYQNCLMDYFIGTYHSGNGTPRTFYVDTIVFDDQLSIPYPMRCLTRGENLWNEEQNKLPPEVIW